MSYLPGQIVYDLDKQRPIRIGRDVWAHYAKRKNRLTHFIQCSEIPHSDRYVISTPTSVAEARALLHRNRITPAPLPRTHCWKSRHWMDNCRCTHCRKRPL